MLFRQHFFSCDRQVNKMISRLNIRQGQNWAITSPSHNHKEKLQIEANEVSSFAKMILELRGGRRSNFYCNSRTSDQPYLSCLAQFGCFWNFFLTGRILQRVMHKLSRGKEMSTCCKIWHLKYFFCNLMTTAANAQGCRSRGGHSGVKAKLLQSNCNPQY